MKKHTWVFVIQTCQFHISCLTAEHFSTDVQKTLVTSEGVETGWKVNVVSPVLLYFTNISNSGIQLGNLDVFWRWADYETTSNVTKDETQDVKLLCRYVPIVSSEHNPCGYYICKNIMSGKTVL